MKIDKINNLLNLISDDIKGEYEDYDLIKTDDINQSNMSKNNIHSYYLFQDIILNLNLKDT